jgi:hypothetical protein
MDIKSSQAALQSDNERISMRTIDATLQAALATGHFTAYIKLRVYRDGILVGQPLQVTKYKLTGNHLTVTVNGMIVVSNTPEQIKVILDRGITSGGVNYILSTSSFTPINGTIEYLTPKQLSISTTLEASLIPPRYISTNGWNAYGTVIEDFCFALGKTAVFKNPGAAYWAYQFLPTGKSVTFNNANNFLALLRQKYFIFACDNGNDEILFYQAFDIPAQDAAISSTLAQVGTGYFQSRRYFSKDEVSALRYAGTAGDQLHNLGFLHSTASLPSYFQQRQPVSVQLPLNLNYQCGDYYSIDGNFNCFPAEVTEVFDPKASPGWSIYISQLEYFTNTEGGALPSTIERVSNYTPLATGNFHGNLDASINNLQAFAERVDDLPIAGGGGHNAVTISGGNGLSIAAGQVLSLGLAAGGVTGALSGMDWTTFNNKQAALVAADSTHNGYLTMADWSTFNGKLSDAPSDGSTYGRKNGAWSVAAGGRGDVYLANANVFTAKQTVQGLNAAGLNEMLKLSGGATGSSGPSIGLYDWYNTGTYPGWRLAEIGAVYSGGSWGGDLIFNVNPGATQGGSVEVLRLGRTSLATITGSLQVNGGISDTLTPTVASGAVLGYSTTITFTPAAQSSAIIKGFYAAVQSAGAQNITGFTAGLQGYVQHTGSGTLANSWGLLFSADNTSTGTITALIGAQISVSNTNASGVVGTATALSIPALVNAGTITTAYGLKIGDVAGAGTNYSIYTGLGLVRFGDVMLPAQAPTASAPAYVKGGIYFDTTLNKLRVGGATAWETITSA